MENIKHIEASACENGAMINEIALARGCVCEDEVSFLIGWLAGSNSLLVIVGRISLCCGDLSVSPLTLLCSSDSQSWASWVQPGGGETGYVEVV